MSIADKLTTIAENVQKVYEAGKAQGGGGISEELMSTFWKAITCGGATERSYANAFYQTEFDNTTFKPTSNFKISEATSMFNYCSEMLGEEKQVDFAKWEEENDVYLDFSTCTTMNNAFRSCGLFKTLGNIDCSNDPTMVRCFMSSTIQRIEYFYPPNQPMVNSFTSAEKLSYIGFDSTVYQNINLQSCPLVNESAILLIQYLEDYSGTEKEFAYTVTLSDEVWANLDALGNVSPNGNTWRDYCGDLGWNT